jgi:predicted transposase YdaD
MRDIREAIERAYEARYAQRWIETGKHEGRLEGKLEGKLEGEASALLRILARRGIALDGAARARVTACTAPATLDAWIDRAVTATSVVEVFGAD